MRKFLLPVVLISSFLMNAQIEFKPGVKAGVNSANITNSVVDAKTDFYAGAFLTVKFADFYNLQPEIVYSRQGAGRPELDGLNADELELNYISLVIANKFFPFKDLGVHAIVGPSFDFKVSDNYDPDFGDDIVGFDFGLIGGVGYEFPFGLSVEARYKQGFVDIFGENVNDTVSFDELFANKVLQVGVAYQFNI